MVMFLLAALIDMTGVDPVQVVEYSIIFSVVILPLTYFPMLMAAEDEDLMGPFKNGWLANTLGWLFLIIITLAALSALPLFLITHGGEG
jgi:manganese transport protein